jgi:uncharacterized protein YbaR (Trm112 family)
MTQLPCPTWLLDYLVCPITQTPLVVPNTNWLDRLAESHKTTPLLTRLGRSVSELPTQGLLNQTKQWFYPSKDGIPTLIPDEAIVVPESLR